MNIIEAIKSGKKFMPKDWGDKYYSFRFLSDWLYAFREWDSEVVENFMQADFIIEERKVEVTESQLREVWDRCIVATGPEAAKADFKESKFLNMCRDLGLRD